MDIDAQLKVWNASGCTVKLYMKGSVTRLTVKLPAGEQHIVSAHSLEDAFGRMQARLDSPSPSGPSIKERRRRRENDRYRLLQDYDDDDFSDNP